MKAVWMASAIIIIGECDHTAAKTIVGIVNERGACGVFQHSMLRADIGGHSHSKLVRQLRQLRQCVAGQKITLDWGPNETT